MTLLDTGCCGMAGAFGALESKYELSLQVGAPLVREDCRATGRHHDCRLRHQLPPSDRAPDARPSEAHGGATRGRASSLTSGRDVEAMTFFQAFIYLLAAVISVPLAKRLGLGSVLGYLLAGVVIGPFVLRFVGTEGDDVMHVAEFGVVMMLFLIGLELRPGGALANARSDPRPRRRPGGRHRGRDRTRSRLRSGCRGRSALAVGLIIAMSSTAIVLQLLQREGRHAGRRAVARRSAVLLFQDIAVIPILALLPLLATFTPSRRRTRDAQARGRSAGLAAARCSCSPRWRRSSSVGRFLLRPVFRFIAATELREMFTATALLLVIGIALLMQQVGLSPALGAFLAGVVLAESEYRHELEADIEPFKGLLLGLFFISVGAAIDFALNRRRNPAPSRCSCVAVLVAEVRSSCSRSAAVSRLEPTQRYLFAFALAQGGEFAFVLCSFATQNGVLTARHREPARRHRRAHAWPPRRCC